MSFTEKTDIKKSPEAALLLVVGDPRSNDMIFGYFESLRCNYFGIKKIYQNILKNINNINYVNYKKICTAVSVYLGCNSGIMLHSLMSGLCILQHSDKAYKNEIIPSYYIKNNKNEYTILFSHGNAADIGLMRNHLLDMHCECNINIFAYEYSGYGLSSGKASIKNSHADIEAAYNYLVLGSNNDKNESLIKAVCCDNDNDNERNSDSDTEYYIFEKFEPVDGGLGMDTQDNDIKRYQVYGIISRLSDIFMPDVLVHLIISFVGPWCNEFTSNILNDMERQSLVNIFAWHLDTFEMNIKQLYYSKSTQCGSCEQYIKSIHCAGPTVTILKTTSGHVFGGYVGRNIWHNSKHTIKFHDPTSLLFNITTDTVYPLKRTDEDAAIIQTHPRIFIEFGWNGDVVAGFVEEAGTIVMGYERSPFDSSSYQYYNDNPIHGHYGALDIEAIELLSLSRK